MLIEVNTISGGDLVHDPEAAIHVVVPCAESFYTGDIDLERNSPMIPREIELVSMSRSHVDFTTKRGAGDSHRNILPTVVLKMPQIATTVIRAGVGNGSARRRGNHGPPESDEAAREKRGALPDSFEVHFDSIW
ncbi:hypothetical protein [Kutzneria buriramensis]|uniref:hypothetical protein n=1 Tax=Kutzneria buriramensis TaxID=1045776 RepID=UPI0011C1A0EB|nr:hypothetical protein [Kutzneria buriramensis]